MKKFFFFFFMLMFYTVGYSQEYNITLQDQKLINPLPGFYIKDVIVAQKEDSCLGILTFGLFKRYEIVYFEKNIRDELKDFLVHSMPANDQLQPMIIRVNRIFLLDLKKFDNHYASLELSVTFIKLKDSLMVEEFTSISVLSELLFEVPFTVPILIKKAFDHCFKTYSERVQTGLLKPVPISYEQIIKNPLIHPGHFNCLIIHTRKKGIYGSYYDFRDNIPDTSLSFKVFHNYNEDDQRLTKTYLKFTDKGEPDDIWGFSDGDGDFIKVGRSFVRLTRDSNLFYTYTRSSEYSEDITSSAVFGGIFFGVVGAAIFGGLTAASADSKYLIKTKLDLFYGKLVPFDAPDHTRIGSVLVFYYSKLSVPGVTLCVLVDGIEQCILTPDTYLKMDLSCHHSEAKITLIASNGAQSVQNIPLQLNKTTVYLVKLFKDRTFMFNKLHDQMKTDMLRKKTQENTKCSVEL